MNIVSKYIKWRLLLALLAGNVICKASEQSLPVSTSSPEKSEYCSAQICKNSNKSLAILLRTAYEVALRHKNSDDYKKCIKEGRSEAICESKKNVKDVYIDYSFKPGGQYDLLIPINRTAKIVDFTQNIQTESYHTTFCYDGVTSYKTCSSLPYRSADLCQIYKNCTKNALPIHVLNAAQFGRFTVVVLSPINFTHKGEVLSTTLHVSLAMDVHEDLVPYLLKALSEVIKKSSQKIFVTFSQISCANTCKIDIPCK